MSSIRGATTIAIDNENEIINATQELFIKIISINNLQEKDINAIIISTTKDITSAYPATAIRRMGYNNTSLFSVAEPDIIDSLPRCIRILVLLENNTKINEKFIYLRDAKNLRKD